MIIGLLNLFVQKQVRLCNNICGGCWMFDVQQEKLYRENSSTPCQKWLKWENAAWGCILSCRLSKRNCKWKAVLFIHEASSNLDCVHIAILENVHSTKLFASYCLKTLQCGKNRVCSFAILDINDGRWHLQKLFWTVLAVICWSGGWTSIYRNVGCG